MHDRDKILDDELALLSFHIPESAKVCARNAMDTWMKECVLLAFEFVAHETTGHSFNKTKDELEFKYKGEWISKEKLFENFL
jgi:hypothetical protein